MITEHQAHVLGITDQWKREHKRSPEERLEDAINVLMELRGPVKTMDILKPYIVKLAKAEIANREDN